MYTLKVTITFTAKDAKTNETKTEQAAFNRGTFKTIKEAKEELKGMFFAMKGNKDLLDVEAEINGKKAFASYYNKLNREYIEREYEIIKK